MDAGVLELTVMRNPKDETTVLQAKHVVSTGPAANRANTVYQIEDKSLVNALETLSRQVAHVNDLQTRIVHLKK